MGAEDIKTVQCDTSAKTCSIKVPAPGFALIFLNDAVYSESETSSTLTFATTAKTQTRNTGGLFFCILVCQSRSKMGYSDGGSDCAGYVERTQRQS